MKANFVVPFDSETRVTTLPTDVAISWVHLTPESPEGTVVVQVGADQEVIDIMLADPQYIWLEDIPEVSTDETAPLLPEGGKSLLVEEKAHPPIASAMQACVMERFSDAVDPELLWNTQEEVVESVCKLHGRTLAEYKQSGLG
jgi:hypothetical protein